MIKNKIQKDDRNIRTHQFIGIVLALALSGTAVAADWKFTAGVGATETYTDNVTLGTSGGRSGDFVTSITPRIGVKKDGARLKVDAQYSMQNLFYTQDSARNTLFHQLNARANAELYENEIFLDTTATISQTSISPLGASGTDNTNATNNLASVYAVTVSPYWIHRFGSTATLNVRNTLSNVSTSSEEFSSSTNNTFNAGLASGSAFGRVSWGLNYSQQSSDYQDRSNVTLSTTTASLGYLVTSRLRLTGTVGRENNSFTTTTGEAPGGVFWNANVSWSPSTRTSIDLGYGHRFFGNTWNFAFKTRGPHSTWSADYSEGLNTSNSQFAGSGIAFTGTRQAPVDVFLFNQNVLTNQVFLSKRFSTAFSWTRGKSDFSLAAFHSTQTTQIDQNTNTVASSLITGNTGSGNDIFLQTNNVKQVGVNGSWNWKFSPLISSNVTYGVIRSSYSDLNRTDTTSSLQLGLNRQFSSQLNGSLSLRRQNRDSDQDISDYTENSISGSVNYSF